MGKELVNQRGLGWGFHGALGRQGGGEGFDSWLPLSGDIGVWEEGQGGGLLSVGDWLVREGRQDHGLVHGSHNIHKALRAPGHLVLVVVLVVVMVVLVLVQVAVLVLVVEGQLVVVIVGLLLAVCVLVVHLVALVLGVVVGLDVVRVGVVVAVPVVVGVSVPMALAVLMGMVVGVSILMPVVGMIVHVSLVMAISVVVAFVRVLVLVNGGMVVLVVVTQAPVDFSSIVAVVQLTSLLVFLFLLL